MRMGRAVLIYSAIFILLGIILFQVKYTVLDLENMHKQLRRDIAQEYEAIHVLNAEWAYLNDPARLKTLAAKHLSLAPITGQQLVSYADLQNSGLGEYDRTQLNQILAGGKKTAEKKTTPPKDRRKT